MPISPSGAQVWRDFITNGVPVSGAHKPHKSQIRAWSSSIESMLEAVSTASAVFETRASLFAVLTYAANTMAWVVSDPVAAYNGIYVKSGGSGSGSWAKVAELPYSFVLAVDGGAGTANAIIATSDRPISEETLVVLNIFETNTASPVTVAFNGGVPMTVKSNTGNDISAGGLVAGMRVMGTVSGSTFRIVTDQVSSAIVAAAEAAAADAEAWAAGVNLPAIASGAAGKVLIVKDDETGYRHDVPAELLGLLPPGGRLTLVSGVPAMQQTADYSSATLYYAPHMSDRITIYDGTSWRSFRFTSGALDPVGLSMAGGTKWAANGLYDVFVVNDGGTLKLATSPAWPASDLTSRGLIRRNGTWVNSASMTLDTSQTDSLVVGANRATWVGSINPASAGTLTATFTQGQNRRCDVWNAYHQVDILLTAGQPPVSGTPVSWKPDTVYTSSFKAFNNDSNNKGRYFTGLPTNVDVKWFQRGFVDSLNFGITGVFWAIFKNSLTTQVGQWASFSSDTATDAYGFTGVATFGDRGSVGAQEVIMGTAKAGATGCSLFGMYPSGASLPPSGAQAMYIRYLG